MDDLSKLVPPEIGWKLAGWGFTGVIALGTMLYKGIWKRINQLSEDIEELRESLHRLIGAHAERHPAPRQWDGIDRRSKARREADE